MISHVVENSITPPPLMTSSPTQTLTRVCTDAVEGLAGQPTVAEGGVKTGSPGGLPHSHCRASSPALGRGPKGSVELCPGGPMHTLLPLAGCTSMQMRARVTSGGKSSAIFSFWPSWEEGTGSRGGGRALRRGSRRAGRRERGPRRGAARGGGRRGGAPGAQGRYDPGPIPRRRPRPGPAREVPAAAPPRPAPPTPAAASRMPRRSAGAGFAARTAPVAPSRHEGAGGGRRGVGPGVRGGR